LMRPHVGWREISLLPDDPSQGYRQHNPRIPEAPRNFACASPRVASQLERQQLVGRMPCTLRCAGAKRAPAGTF
jgi:hypothetical protein